MKLACKQTLFYFSFRSFQKHNKCPADYILSPALDGLWRENRGSVNRLAWNRRQKSHSLLSQNVDPSRAWSTRKRKYMYSLELKAASLRTPAGVSPRSSPFEGRFAKRPSAAMSEEKRLPFAGYSVLLFWVSSVLKSILSAFTPYTNCDL